VPASHFLLWIWFSLSSQSHGFANSSLVIEILMESNLGFQILRFYWFLL